MKLVAALVISTLSSCSGAPKAKEPVEAAGHSSESSGPKKKTTYTLKQGDTVQLNAPLPARTGIELRMDQDGERQAAQESFRGWDFDRDGRYDMLEVLDLKGETVSSAYDFNGDGVIDLVQKARENEASVKREAVGEPGVSVSH
jgi:hypothetical protein